MPTDDKSVIPAAEVGCNDLGVFVKIAVTGRQHGCTGSSVSSHGTICLLYTSQAAQIMILMACLVKGGFKRKLFRGDFLSENDRNTV